MLRTEVHRIHASEDTPRVVVQRWLSTSGGEGSKVPLELLALAALAGQTLVAAATTDAWESAKRGFARLLGRGDQEREALAERRLDNTREELQGALESDREQARTRLEAVWQTRLIDLLEEHPDAASDLQVLIDRIQAELPARVVSASGHGVAAGGNVNINASGGGVAAGTIQGNVSPSNPT